MTMASRRATPVSVATNGVRAMAGIQASQIQRFFAQLERQELAVA